MSFPAAAQLDLRATAKHDADGTGVTVTVVTRAANGMQLSSQQLAYSNLDDLYDVQDGSPATIPVGTRFIRFTYDDDSPPAKDFWLDAFEIGGLVTIEGEDFTSTGGTDPVFPGCAVVDDAGTIVADCGNLNDYVEYDLARFVTATAKHYAAGVVTATLDAKSDDGTVLSSQQISFGNLDDLYAVQDGSAAPLPAGTRYLRFTFDNDTPSAKNLWLDLFQIGSLTIEGEHFTTTGGTDPLFPGCGVVDDAGTIVADCGHLNDYAEYDLALFMEVTARHYSAGVVTATLEATNSSGVSLGSQQLAFSNLDDAYDGQDGSAVQIPAGTRFLRFTYDHDSPPAKNFWLDFFELGDGLLVEGQHFIATGGTDPLFPGCTVVTDGSRIVADCGNLDDYVVYDIDPPALPLTAPLGSLLVALLLPAALLIGRRWRRSTL